jgi:hypothetical protein
LRYASPRAAELAEELPDDAELHSKGLEMLFDTLSEIEHPVPIAMRHEARSNDVSMRM